MKLLTSERQWLRWLQQEVGLYASDIKERRDHASTAPGFPCYGYAVVQSFGYEEKAPVYISPDQLRAMVKKIDAAILSSAPPDSTGGVKL